jgi:hypothetical protein
MSLNYGPTTSYQIALPLSYNTFCEISRRYYVHIRIQVIDGKNRKKGDVPALSQLKTLCYSLACPALPRLTTPSRTPVAAGV